MEEHAWAVAEFQVKPSKDNRDQLPTKHHIQRVSITYFLYFSVQCRLPALAGQFAVKRQKSGMPLLQTLGFLFPTPSNWQSHVTSQHEHERFRHGKLRPTSNKRVRATDPQIYRETKSLRDMSGSTTHLDRKTRSTTVWCVCAVRVVEIDGHLELAALLSRHGFFAKPRTMTNRTDDKQYSYTGRQNCGATRDARCECSRLWLACRQLFIHMFLLFCVHELVWIRCDAVIEKHISETTHVGNPTEACNIVVRASGYTPHAIHPTMEGSCVPEVGVNCCRVFPFPPLMGVGKVQHAGHVSTSLDKARNLGKSLEVKKKRIHKEGEILDMANFVDDPYNHYDSFGVRN